MIKKLLLCIILVFVCADHVFPQPQKIKKNERFYSFQTAEPEEEGFFSSRLRAIFPYVRDHQVNVHSLMIIKSPVIKRDLIFRITILERIYL